MRHPLTLALTLTVGLGACTSPSGPRLDAIDMPPAGSGYQVQQALSSSDRSAIFREILRLTNYERQRRGLKPLISSGIAGIVGTRHSEDMAARNYFAHTSPNGVDEQARLRRFVNFTVMYENISKLSPRALSRVANDAMYTPGWGWMNSPTHRDNLLNPTVTRIGIGSARAADGSIYITQILFRRPEDGAY